MSTYYAGIGSRETAQDICDLMTKIALRKRDEGHILRSGGAKGADTAFEIGSGDHKEIYVAGKSREPHHYGPPTQAAIDLAAKHHPAWYRCSAYAKLLHGRNSHIILGRNLDIPVEVVICWTPNADASGGTGQGIRIADAYGIKVHDLGLPHWLDFYQKLLATEAIHVN